MPEFPEIVGANYKHDYNKIFRSIADGKIAKIKTYRELCKKDLFFLLYFGLGQTHVNKKFVVNTIREVEEDHYDTLDLWAREHFKSCLLTHGLPIQEVIKNPEERICIFSHTRPIAKGFLREIKQALENEPPVKIWFRDIFHKDPKKQAFKWSEDDGLIVKRKSTAKESTFEAWGLVDGQPTALAIDTPVLTTKGWVPHGYLQVGDFVFDENGFPVEVIHNSGPMSERNCCRVKFKDTEIIAAADHLWAIDRTVSPRDNITGKQIKENQYTTREIVKTTELPISRGDNRSRRRCLPRTPTVFFQPRELKLDPYILGLWLGDGSTHQELITTPEVEIIDWLELAGFKCEIKQDRKTYKMYRPIGLWALLKKIGVAKNKHIPDEYLFNSIENRRALLQGLMDTDGSCHKNGWGQCIFTNTNINLIRGVHFLAASLGMHPTRIRREIFQNKNHNDRYTVCFLGIKKEAPFRLTRKLNRCRERRHNKGRYVHGVESVASVDVNCIQVLSESGLYLAGESLVVTHNSKHFTIRVYDDIVTKDSVTNPEQIKKTREAYELSQSLGTIGGKKRVLGTHYHFADLYTHLKKKGGYNVRIKPAINKAGEPVLLTKERLRELKHEQGSYIFSCQQLLQPIPEADQSFNEKWLRFWPASRFSHLNIYILCDPASSKKKTSDYTTFFVIGAGEDEKYYIITMVRDRLNLKERADHLFALHRQYRPLDVGYEKYGMQADIEHFQDRMNRENYRFEITELKGRIAKEDRIRGLVPLFEAGRIYLPDTCVRRNYEGISEDLTKIFMDEEFNAFPIVVHDDMLDGLARIRDPEFDMRFPKSRRHIGPLQKTADGEYDELGY